MGCNRHFSRFCGDDSNYLTLQSSWKYCPLEWWEQGSSSQWDNWWPTSLSSSSFWCTCNRICSLSNLKFAQFSYRVLLYSEQLNSSSFVDIRSITSDLPHLQLDISWPSGRHWSFIFCSVIFDDVLHEICNSCYVRGPHICGYPS